MPMVDRGRIGAFAVIVTVLLIAQGLLAWSMYSGSRSSLAAAQNNNARRSAEDAAKTVMAAGGAETDAATLVSLLRQVRDADHLTTAMIVDERHRIVADAAGAPPGTPVSALAADHSLLDRALAGEPAQASNALNDDFTTWFFLPLAGKSRAALCIEADDPVPELMDALRRPLLGVFSLMALSTLVLAALAMAARRAIDRAHGRAIAVERLATLGTLAASISHEVKNPMGIIMSATQLLNKSPTLSSDDRALIADIAEEVERADDQLNAILDLARDMPLKLSPCDLSELARSTVELMTPRAQGAEVALTCEAPESVSVSGDRRRLRQALVNLVLNALEAVGSGGKVRVSVIRDRAQNVGRIEVNDDGPGIPAEARKQLFEPFATSKAEGTGLGLATSRRILERHGGRCDLLSDDRGTTAIIELPLSEGGVDAHPGG